MDRFNFGSDENFRWKSKKVILSIITIILLLTATLIAFYLSQNPQIFRSKASEKKEGKSLNQKQEFQGYIIEFKDPSVVGKVAEPGKPGIIAPQSAADYSKNTLSPAHKKAKEDIFARLSPTGNSASNSYASAVEVLTDQPQTTFSLIIDTPEIKIGSKIKISLFARSDADNANLFVAKLKFPAEFLNVIEVQKPETSPIKNWIENSYDNQPDVSGKGTVSLVAGVPDPGYKTESGKNGILMAEIVFEAKKVGTAVISFDNDSAIYRNSDNSNILATKSDFNIKVVDQEGGASGTAPKPVVLGEYFNTFNGIALDITKEQVEQVKQSPYVKAVYPNLEVKTNLNQSVPLIQADQVWTQKDSEGKNITGKGVNVAVLDTGVDYTHPDLGKTEITERNFEIVTPESLNFSGFTDQDQMMSLNNGRLAYVSDDKFYVYDFSTEKRTGIDFPEANLKVLMLSLNNNILAYYGSGASFRPSIYYYDLTTNTHKKIVNETSRITSLAITNGKIVYQREDTYGSSSVNIYVYDTNTGIEEAILPADVKDILFFPRAANNLIAYSAGGANCSSRDVIYDINTKISKDIYPPGAGPILDFDGSRILYTSCDQAGKAYYLYDINSGEATSLQYPKNSSLGGMNNAIRKNSIEIGDSYVIYIFANKGAIGSGIVSFNKSSAETTKLVTYDTNLKRYVQINLVTPIQSLVSYEKKICFISTDRKIYCHDYDSNNSYLLPDNIFNNKVIDGYNFIANDNNPLDDMGHGTHVAATIAGTSNSGSLTGVAPGANIIAYKVLDSWGSGSFSTVIAGVDKAVSTRLDSDPSNNIDIISMSLGADCGVYSQNCGPDDPLSKAIDNAVDSGIVAVIAAGNNGPDGGTIGTPGTARKAITVGAIDKQKQMASFSSRGPVIYNGETINKPDVVAPGVYICAAEWSGWLSDKRCIDDKHIAINGTSMATPHVAGAVALIKQVHFDWTPLQIKNAILNTATNLGFPTDSQGKGLVNAWAGIFGTMPTLTPTPTSVPAPITTARVFVTATTYNGNLGGLSGADEKCQENAYLGNLGGIWKAWLSDSTTSAESRLTHTGPFKLINGMVIANDWEDLVDGELQNKININQYRLPADIWSYAWTGTNESGSGIGAENCSNWTDDGTNWIRGLEGATWLATKGWTNNALLPGCGMQMSLYCFEQSPPSPIPTQIPTATPTLTVTPKPTVTPPLTPSPTPGPHTPTPSTCLPKPACLNAPIPCTMPEPAEGWCPEPSTIVPTSTKGLSGDVNNDGKITLVDMSALLSRWGKRELKDGRADLNNDGVINTMDYSMTVKILIDKGIIKSSSELPSNLQLR